MNEVKIQPSREDFPTPCKRSFIRLHHVHLAPKISRPKFSHKKTNVIGGDFRGNRIATRERRPERAHAGSLFHREGARVFLFFPSQPRRARTSPSPLGIHFLPQEPGLRAGSASGVEDPRRRARALVPTWKRTEPAPRTGPRRRRRRLLPRRAGPRPAGPPQPDLRAPRAEATWPRGGGRGSG